MVRAFQYSGKRAVLSYQSLKLLSLSDGQRSVKRFLLFFCLDGHVRLDHSSRQRIEEDVLLVALTHNGRRELNSVFCILCASVMQIRNTYFVSVLK